MTGPKGVRVISRAELAKAWGISPNTVDILAQRGKLKRVSTGLYDYDAAMAMRAGQDAGRIFEGRLANGRPLDGKPEEPAAGAADKPASSAAASIAQDTLTAKTAKAVNDAKLAQLRVREAKGEMLPRDEVKRTAFSAGMILRASLENFGRRYAPQMTLRPEEECRAVLDRAMFEIAQEFTQNMNALLPEGIGLKIENYWPEKPSGVPEARRR